tara:strand:+ start:370 stop:498 length:129 start_codon:yes stop_codon:yes gene_type:complete
VGFRAQAVVIGTDVRAHFFVWNGKASLEPCNAPHAARTLAKT